MNLDVPKRDHWDPRTWTDEELREYAAQYDPGKRMVLDRMEGTILETVRQEMVRRGLP